MTLTLRYIDMDIYTGISMSMRSSEVSAAHHASLSRYSSIRTRLPFEHAKGQGVCLSTYENLPGYLLSSSTMSC